MHVGKMARRRNTMALVLRLDEPPAHQDPPPLQRADRTADVADLAPVEVKDADTFLAAAEHARIKSWFYYFPRLYFYGQNKAHRLRWERHAGSILVYQIRQRKVGSQMNSRMDLYLPPFPFDPAALR